MTEIRTQQHIGRHMSVKRPHFGDAVPSPNRKCSTLFKMYDPDLKLYLVTCQHAPEAMLIKKSIF